jgi:Family of unknown function (DUF5995)
MPNKNVLINIEKITSFDTVLKELVMLERLLPLYKLDHFVIFNKAYATVTNAIKKGATNGHFDNPIFIEKFSVKFAHYYFKAVNETMGKSKDLPAAWKMLNKAAKHKSTPKFIFLLMGANAHINNDLPLALLELMDKETTDDLLKDVLKIDKLLMKSGREIIGLFSEPNKVLNLLKRRVVFLYYRPVMYMILYWRIKAWKNYKLLKKAGQDDSGYKRGSVAIANRFLKLAALFS